MDSIYFGSTGAVLLFKYPLMKRKIAEIQNQMDGMEFDIVEVLMEDKLTEDISNLVCEDYTEEEIKHDFESIDWEKAYEQITKIENSKREMEIKMIEAERDR